MRVLHIANHVDEVIGGSIFATFQMAACAARAGCLCEVATTIDPRNNRAPAFERYFPEVRIHPFPYHFPKRNHASVSMFQWLSRYWNDYDIIHCHQIFHWPFIYCGLLAGKRRAPLVISPHNSLDPHDLKKKAALKQYIYGPYIIRPTLSRARAILGTADEEVANAVDYGATPAPMRTHLPLPVPELPAPNRAFRRCFDISSDAFVVLFLSRLDVKKNIPLLIRAFSKLRRNDSELILAIVGTGDKALEAECRQLCDQLGIASRVRWCGFLTGEDKAAAYAESNLFVLPSTYENFAMVVVEAMYAGLPVITTTGIYIHQELAAAGAAKICEPNEAAIGSALEEFVSNPDLCATYSSVGARFARTHYLPDVVGHRYREFYETIKFQKQSRIWD